MPPVVAKRSRSESLSHPNDSKRRRINTGEAQLLPVQPQRQPWNFLGILQSAISLVPEAMSRPFRGRRHVPPPQVVRPAPIPGMEADPRGSLAALLQPQTQAPHQSPPTTTSGRQKQNIIVIDDVSEVDPEEDRMRTVQGAKRSEARRHLNDLAAGESAVHPLLPAPLFPSMFGAASTSTRADTSTNAIASATATTSTSAKRSTDTLDDRDPGPSRRPDVSYLRPEREREWAARADSPGSSTSSTSPQRRRRASSNFRHSNVNANLQQLKFLDRIVSDAERNGAPNLPALQRTRDQLRFATETRVNESRPSPRKHKPDLASALKSLHLDHRRPLDEALTRVDKKFEPPRTTLKPRPTPKPFDIDKSELYEQIKRYDAEVERQLKKRLEVKIPRSLAPDQDAIADERLDDRYFKVTVGNAEVDAKSLHRLHPVQWLNDDIINFYIELINARSKANDTKVLGMNTFFYQKLDEQGYAKANLKRWTKRMKVDIFALNKFLVPINLGNMHWVCAVIDFARKRIEYYDSMADHGNKNKVFKKLREYLQEEHKEKKGTSFDLTDWVDSFNPNTPRQRNGSDCGVFACQTLESAARGRDLVADGFEFNGANMEFFRRLMVIEIASCELSDRFWGK